MRIIQYSDLGILQTLLWIVFALFIGNLHFKSTRCACLLVVKLKMELLRIKRLFPPLKIGKRLFIYLEVKYFGLFRFFTYVFFVCSVYANYLPCFNK